MTPLRVVHFLWTGNTGGAERAVYQVVREEVRRREWEVGVAFGRAEGPYFDAVRALGCEVVDLRMRSGADLPRALYAAGRLTQFDIHHLHVLEPTQIVASARCDGVARVFTQRGGLDVDPLPKRKRIRRSFGRMLLRKYVHAVSGNTRHASRLVVERYGLGRVPSCVTYNGIDFSLLTPGRDRMEVRRELGITPESFVVGSSGNFKPCKRFDRVVALLGSRADIDVVLVGDGSLRDSLEDQARALGTSDRLHITGLVDNVADYLPAMDVFVLASSASESFGNSVVEAMAMGIPSIVFSDSPGLCEHIEDHLTGFVVKDQTELVSLVERLRADPVLRTAVGPAGARHVRSKYTLEHMHSAYGQLYETALQARGAGR